MSYSPVYSAPFILYTDDTPNRDFLVPDGYTVVIRQVSYWLAIAGGSMNVEFGGADSGESIVIAALNAGGINAGYDYPGHWVVPAGYNIHYNSSVIGSGSTAYVGGYLLRNTLP